MPQQPSDEWEVISDDNEWEVVNEEEESLLGSLYRKATTPLIDAPSRLSKIAADYIDPPKGEGGYVRGFLAGSLTGLGDVISGLTSPLDLAATATGLGAVGAARRGLKGAEGLRRATQALSAPVALHGAGTVVDNERPLAERATGLAEMAGGLAGMHFPKPTARPRAKVLEPEVLGPEVIPEGRRLEPGPRFIAGEAGVADVNERYTHDILSPVKEFQKEATILPRDFGEIIDLKPDEAARGLGKVGLVTEDVEFKEPSPARAGDKVKIGADIESLGRVLGSSLYKGDISTIATKELVQNSLDAIRHLGSEGKIDITFIEEKGNRAVEVADNGRGLTGKELETIFLDLGSSGKRSDEGAIGGFGLAKASFLLGGKNVEVTTIARDGNKTYKHVLSGTPEDLLAGVNIKRTLVSNETPTGTVVKVGLADESNFYDAQRFLEHIGKYSNISSKVQARRRYSNEDNPKFEPIERALNNKLLTTISTPIADTGLIIPSDSRYRTSSNMEMIMLNKGMYQSRKYLYFPQQYPNMPDKVVVDVSSKVPEGSNDYPFTANREELRGDIETKVKEYITDKIINPTLKKRKDELTKVYKEMPFAASPRGVYHYHDSGNKYTPDEVNQVVKSQTIGNIADALKIYADEAVSFFDPTLTEKMERVGIIFDDRLRGVYIPNPGSRKGAVMINPFQLMTDRTPDEASAGLLHTLLHELVHLKIGDHNEDFTINLGDMYEKFGAQKSVEAQQRFYDAITKPGGGGYSFEVQDLLRKYQESRRREPVTNDLLFGTGIGAKVGPEGKGKVPLDSKSVGKGTTGRAVSNLFDAIERLRPLREQQENMYSAERAKRFKKFENVKEEGEAGARKSMKALQGEFDKINTSATLMDQDDLDTLFSTIKHAPIFTGHKAAAYRGLYKILNGGHVPQRNELAALDRVFGGGFGSKVIELQGGLGAVGGLKLAKTANTMKAIMSSMDLSAPFRQGFPLIGRKEYWTSFIDMFKFAGNKRIFDDSMEALKNRKNNALGEESGLYLADTESLEMGEEAFMENYIHDISKTGIGKVLTAPIQASERAYVGFLNKLRADTFDALILDAEKAGIPTTYDKVLEDGSVVKVPTRTAKSIAKFVNVMTGRGNLRNLEPIARELNMALFSPRLISSRVTMLNPKFYMNLDPISRREALKSWIAMSMAWGTVATITTALGADINTDLTSTDFMKSKFGNTRLDPYAGLQQYVVRGAQMMDATYKIFNGVKDEDQSGIFQKTPANIAGRFAANKLSPMASLAFTLTTAREGKEGQTVNAFGDPISMTNETKNRVMPMYMQDMEELIRNEPNFFKVLGISIPMFLGMGMQEYKTEENTNTPMNTGMSMPRLSF